MKTLPKARKEGIIVRELPDEVLIYDRHRDQAHCLNQTAGFVWQHCDGRTRVATVARLLSTKGQTPVDESVVLLALDQLAERHLLIESSTRPFGARVSRRKLVLKYAPAALALPVVLSITAPTAAAAATPTPPPPTPNPACAVPNNKPDGCPCVDNAECVSGDCIGGICTQLKPKPE